jgi:RND family efflux transporter MFP subunit
MDDLLAGASATELRNAEIDLEMAQMALDSLEQQREDSVLVAPFDGIVAAVNVDVGEIPSPNAFTLIDTSSYTMTLSVDEKDITQLEVGQSVSVSISALNNASLTGTVTWIDLAPSSTSGLVTYSVEVTLDPADAPVRPGMTAVANVVLNEVDGVIVVPNRFITTDASGQTTVKVQTGTDTYSDIPVTLGAQTDSESVITGGIDLGQTLVILSSGDSSETATTRTGLGLLGGGLAGGGGPPGGFAGGGAGGGR